MYKAIIVDDEIMIKKSLTKLIEQYDGRFRVIGEAEDGQEALALVKQLSPDLVITDIHMPVMDGLELIREIRGNKPNVEIVVISGYAEFEYARESLKYGVAEYLLKPLKPAELRQTLDRVYGKIHSSRNNILKQSEILLDCRKKSETLTDLIWSLQEQEALRVMEQNHGDFTATLAQWENLAQAYELLFTLVIRELHRRLEDVPFASILDERFQGDPDQLLLKAKSHIVRMMETLRAMRNLAYRERIRRAVAYIDEQYHRESLNLSEVAEKANMSPSYFSRLFKEEMGIGFLQYITKLRMGKAKQLLRDPAYKTFEVASAVGYSDYTHFAKTFKKQEGISPTDYRKQTEGTIS